jgi:hypothetical protein
MYLSILVDYHSHGDTGVDRPLVLTPVSWPMINTEVRVLTGDRLAPVHSFLGQSLWP